MYLRYPGTVPAHTRPGHVISNMSRGGNLPWLCFGNAACCTNALAHLGGRGAEARRFQKFREILLQLRSCCVVFGDVLQTCYLGRCFYPGGPFQCLHCGLRKLPPVGSCPGSLAGAATTEWLGACGLVKLANLNNQEIE